MVWLDNLLLPGLEENLGNYCDIKIVEFTGKNLVNKNKRYEKGGADICVY